jgi:hypothetical protein
MEKHEKVYQELKRRIKADLIDSGELGSGDPLPTRVELIKRFGGSTRSMMKAIQMLEREGLIVRLSPKKFALTVHPSTPESENSIGLIGFEGDLYGNLGSRLAHSLYDRNIFAYSLNSSGSIPDFDRLLTRILGNGIRTLLLRDGSPMPVKSIESRKDKFSQFILMLSIYNRWNIPYHGVLLDQAFPMYDGLLKLCEAGCKNIHVLNAGDPPGCENPRDRRTTGIKMFFDEGLDKKFNCKVSVTDYYELSGNPRKTVKWASSIDPKTDALFGAFDYYVIDAQLWLKRYSKLDWQKLKYLGQANSTWSHQGPNQFASYDFRLEDLSSMALELIDSPPKESLIRRIRPKLVRQELLA